MTKEEQKLEFEIRYLEHKIENLEVKLSKARMELAIKKAENDTRTKIQTPPIQATAK